MAWILLHNKKYIDLKISSVFLGLVALLILNNAGRRSVSDTSAIGNLLVNKRHGVFRATLSLLNEARPSAITLRKLEFLSN